MEQSCLATGTLQANSLDIAPQEGEHKEVRNVCLSLAREQWFRWVQDCSLSDERAKSSKSYSVFF